MSTIAEYKLQKFTLNGEKRPDHMFIHSRRVPTYRNIFIEIRTGPDQFLIKGNDLIKAIQGCLSLTEDCKIHLSLMEVGP